MLRRRLITVLTFNDGVLFRTRNFQPDYRYTTNFVDAWSVDEIIALDITRAGQGKKDHFYEAVQQIASECFVPLAVGGGIRGVEEFKHLLRIGADKIVINTGAIDTPELITEAARLFGTQCVIVSVDAHKRGPGQYEVYADCGSRPTGLDPAAWASEASDLGAGEICINAIEKDGTLEGYDNELNGLVADAVDVPVLVCGGAGKWQDFVDGFRVGKATAICTTNIYHFTESSIRSAKQFLRRNDILVRV